MADTDLRSSLEAAIRTEEAKVETPPASSAVEAPAPAPAPATKTLDEIKADTVEKPGEPPASDPEKPQKPVEEGKEPGTTETPAPSSADKAPISWKPVAKAHWDKLPQEVRQDVKRRELEMERTLSETANVRKFVSNFQEAVKPFASRYQAMNLHPVAALRSLMQVDHVLALGSPADKAKMIAKMITDYGVDVSMTDAALAGQEVDDNAPETKFQKMLDERLAPLVGFVQQTQQQREHEVQSDLQRQVQTIENMAADTTKYPHFETVRQDMADLIEISLKRKVDLPLEQAYTRAVAMNPEATAAQAEITKRSNHEQANAAARRALGASLSVGGAPASVKSGFDASDLRGTLEAAVAAHSGR